MSDLSEKSFLNGDSVAHVTDVFLWLQFLVVPEPTRIVLAICVSAKP
jgi:hypothetical protein